MKLQQRHTVQTNKKQRTVILIVKRELCFNGFSLKICCHVNGFADCEYCPNGMLGCYKKTYKMFSTQRTCLPSLNNTAGLCSH